MGFSNERMRTGQLVNWFLLDGLELTPANSGTAALLQPWNGTPTPDALKKVISPRAGKTPTPSWTRPQSPSPRPPRRKPKSKS